MKKLDINCIGELNRLLESIHLRTFYHYAPLIVAISETNDTPLLLDEYGRIWINTESKELYMALNFEPPFEINEILVNSIPSQYPTKFNSEVYDKNFIFDLEKTLNLKNFKANTKKFRQRVDDRDFVRANPRESLEVVRKWYLKRKSGDFFDFDYTVWLCTNFQKLDGLYADMVIIDNKPIAFSLWGELDKDTAIHIISKDTRQYPYVQEYLRTKVYEEMLNKGFRFVNDGSDCGLHELQVFKLKLRPHLIIPVWSWTRK